MTTNLDYVIWTGKQRGWSRYTLFYHVTPKSRLSSILAEGLLIPEREDIVLSRLIEPKTYFPGIYLDEDREMILYTIAGVAMERGYSEPLSLLKVWVEDTIRLTSDPVGPPGTVIALDPISPELVWVEVEEITKDMIPEEP